ncbi:MAG: type II toxin-antitoxin system VapC family toxin [Egibacteraceae bacterium]
MDVSAAVKLVVDEAESDALRRWLGQPRLIGSALLEVELMRAVRRARPDAVERARTLLETVGLVPVDEGVLRHAALLDPPVLRTLDAVHLATALTLRLANLTLVTYDDRLGDAARAAGLAVVSPA